MFRLPHQPQSTIYLAYCDANHVSPTCGQTCYILGSYLPEERIFYVLDREGLKQIQVAFSLIGAEILAAVTSTDRGPFVKERHSA